MVLTALCHSMLYAECVAGSQLSQLVLEGTTKATTEISKYTTLPYMDITVSRAIPLYITKAWLKKENALVDNLGACTGTSRAGWWSIKQTINSGRLHERDSGTNTHALLISSPLGSAGRSDA